MCHVRVKLDPMSRGSEDRGLDVLVAIFFYLTQQNPWSAFYWEHSRLMQPRLLENENESSISSS